jgi:hypothetical protein
MDESIRATPKSAVKPFYMFFYGSLMDRDVLQFTAELYETPLLLPASVVEFEMAPGNVRIVSRFGCILHVCLLE